MKQVVLAGFNWTSLTNFALVLFLGLFIGMMIWVFRKDSKDIYREASSMPFAEEGENNEKL